MSAHYRSHANAEDQSNAAHYLAAELAALAPRLEKRLQLERQIAALRHTLHSTRTTTKADQTLSPEQTSLAYAHLAEFEQQRAELAQVEARAASLTAEIANARVGSTPKRRLPNLDAISVAAPCDAKWDSMVGNDQARHCGECDKQVFNLSAMTRVEAETFLESQLVAPCIRFYRRTDGTLLTQDCPVGVKRRKRRRTFAAIGLALTNVGGLGMYLLAGAGRQTAGGMMPMGLLAVPSPVAEPAPYENDDFLHVAYHPEAQSNQAEPEGTAKRPASAAASHTCGLSYRARK